MMYTMRAHEIAQETINIYSKHSHSLTCTVPVDVAPFSRYTLRPVYGFIVFKFEAFFTQHFYDCIVNRNSCVDQTVLRNRQS